MVGLAPGETGVAVDDGGAICIAHGCPFQECQRSKSYIVCLTLCQLIHCSLQYFFLICVYTGREKRKGEIDGGYGWMLVSDDEYKMNGKGLFI